MSLRDSLPSFLRRKPHFPDGNYYAILGEIAENYRGMTNVVFHRTKNIAESGVPIDILTTGANRDYKALQETLRNAGVLHHRTFIRNMFDDLCARNDIAGPFDPDPTFELLPLPITQDFEYVAVERRGQEVQRTVYHNGGKLKARDFLRADGTIAISERRDINNLGRQSDTAIFVHDSAGKPIRHFDSIIDLRYYWLDLVFNGEKTFLFSDSRRNAGYLSDYDRENVTIIQTLHTNHISDTQSPQLSTVEASHYQLVDSSAKFDSLTFLTNRHRDDFIELMGDTNNLAVIPNSRSFHAPDRSIPRIPRHGIIAASATSEKRVDHAIRAVALVNRENPQERVILEHCGSGPRIESLISLSQDLSVNTDIVFSGHVSDLPKRFAYSSFSLLTSESEAFALVIIESMAAGCIPIAYDVKYGPRELIKHGVNGFLVDPGDIQSLGSAIRTVTAMSEHSLSAMRAAAIDTARRYDDLPVTCQWADLVSASANRSRRTRFTTKSTVTRVEIDGDGLTLSFTIRTNQPAPKNPPRLIGKTRTGNNIFGIICESTDSGDGNINATVRIPYSYLNWQTSTLDFYVELYDPGYSRSRLKIKSPLKSKRFPDTVPGYELYITAYNSLSMKKTSS